MIHQDGWNDQASRAGPERHDDGHRCGQQRDGVSGGVGGGRHEQHSPARAVGSEGAVKNPNVSLPLKCAAPPAAERQCLQPSAAFSTGLLGLVHARRSPAVPSSQRYRVW